MTYKPYFSGYFRNPELTATKMRADGWVHTGDIGRFNEDGTISLIGRMNYVIKNSAVIFGEYNECVINKIGRVHST